MIKNYIIIILCAITIGLSAYGYFAYKKSVELKNNWIVSENNYKASDRKNLAYQVTIEQLELSNDSLDIKLLDFKKRNKIKDSKINFMMIIIDSLKKQDTVIFKDTIFVKDLKIDTIIGDRWIKKKLKLRYPNCISIDEEIYNEKNISWSNKREIIGDSSKIFFVR